MTVNVFPSGPFATNAYVLVCPKTKQTAIIDPAPGCSDPVSTFLTKNNLTPTKILITHSHWDHIAEAAWFKAKFNIPVLVHSNDAGNLKNPGSDGVGYYIHIPPVADLTFVNEGDTIPLGDLEINVIHTPGHSPGGICFYCGNNAQYPLLFTGDTLFRGTIGNLSLPTGQPDLMWDSLKKLAALPKNTKVYPGHGSSTTIGTETWLADPQSVFEI